ncbi:MAG TPA: CoA-binding protein [Euzebyales bacterium]|nr:CoA-binding protein [Euzebyales bacterium]
MTGHTSPQAAPHPPADTDAAVEYVLERFRVFAVVGASPRPWRPSHGVMQTLIRHGYDVVPVNPTCDEVLGRTAYPDLAAVPASVGIEVVDIFRRSELAGRHVDEAIEIGAAAVWMQLGVIDEDAAERARAAGLAVVMDRCPAIELAGRR